MKNVFVLFVAVGLVGLAAIYAYMNRGSEKVILAFTVAVIVACTGFILRELLDNTELTKKEVFIVSYGFNPQTLRFIDFEDSSNIASASLQNLTEENIKTIKERSSNSILQDPVQDFFNELTAFVIIGHLANEFNHSWDVEKTIFTTPTGVTTGTKKGKFGEQGKKISSKAILEMFVTDSFQFFNHEYAVGGMRKNIVFPPNSKVQVKNVVEEGVFDRYVIEIKNKFVQLDIAVSSDSFFNLGLGELSDLKPASWPEGAVKNVKVEITYKLNWWLRGNPKMPFYSKWGDSVITSIKQQLDYTVVRDRILN